MVPREHPLSPRERECLYWAAQGKTCYETGLILGLGATTVKVYLDNARYKLNAVNLAHAAALAVKLGIIDPLVPFDRDVLERCLSS
jgi:DNA-binding CsgD family transcriptional regulator